MRIPSDDTALMERLAELAREGTLLYPRDVIRIFECDPKTVWQWGESGKIGMRVIDGQRRYSPADVLKMLKRGSPRRGQLAGAL